MTGEETRLPQEILLLKNGRDIPILPFSFNISLLDDRKALLQKLSENEVHVQMPEYAYRCISKPIAGFENFHSVIKIKGIDRPISRFEDLQLTPKKPDFAYFYQTSLTRDIKQVSIVLIYNPGLLSLDMRGFDSASYDAIKRKNNAIYDDILLKSLESVVEIHWKK